MELFTKRFGSLLIFVMPLFRPHRHQRPTGPARECISIAPKGVCCGRKRFK